MFSPHAATHRYVWRNNAKRAELYGGYCRILATGALCSALVEFCDGTKGVVSRRALRRIPRDAVPGR